MPESRKKMIINGTTTKRKHEQVYQKLVHNILSGQYSPGQRIPNEHELAKLHNTSRPTIGKALEKLEKGGLVVRRQGAGTFIRIQSPVGEQKLGLMIPKLQYNPDHFPHFVSLFSIVVSQMSQTAGANDYVLLLNELPEGSDEKLIEHEWKICQQLIDMRVKGVFFFPFPLSLKKADTNKAIAQTLDNAGIAVTLLDHDVCSWPERSKFDVVGARNEQSSFTITDYLLSLGCKRIAFIGIANHISVVKARIFGYRAALLEHSITPDPALLFDMSDLMNNAAIGSEKKAFDHILKQRAEAIVCVNDRLAAQFMQHAINSGIRIPDDICLVGFDDEAFCNYLPVPLTTIRQSAAAIGAEAVRTMISRINNPQLPGRDILLPTELVIRKSCKEKNTIKE